MVGAGLERARAGVLQVAGCNSDERLDNSPSDRGCFAFVGRLGGEEAELKGGRIKRDGSNSGLPWFLLNKLNAWCAPRGSRRWLDGPSAHTCSDRPSGS